MAASPEARFRIDRDALSHVTQWLSEAGIGADRLTSEQINDLDGFNAQKYDALIVPGDFFPRINVRLTQFFVEQGGVLIVLGAQTPFLINAELESGGWMMSPKEPKFAWQSDVMQKFFGMRYVFNPGKHDLGFQHTATPLLKQYVPNAPDILNQRLPSRWIVPFGDAAYYPLVRSKRLDGRDTTPQLFVVQNGARRAIISTSDLYTSGDSKTWPVARETIIGLTKLAADLRDGKPVLTPDAKIELPENSPPPEPLTTRLANGSVQPEAARPLVRWGRFDGSRLELGPTLDAGKSKTIALGAKNADFPNGLAPGASVSLALPDLGSSPRVLRIRGGFAQSGAGLKAVFGGATLWNEVFNYIDAGGAGNFESADIKDVPVEFTRLVFLPPGAAKELVLSNFGTQPLFFDALQIETPTHAAPTIIVGLGAGTSLIPRQLSASWSATRAVLRTQDAGAPDSSDRWAKIDASLDQITAASPHIQLIFEGTPQWAAISDARYSAESNKDKWSRRPWDVPPDPQKYGEIAAHVAEKYGDKIDAYEIWNEGNSGQFYKGTAQEYVQLFDALYPILKKLDPTSQILTTGMAGFSEPFIDALSAGGTFQKADLFAFHAYAGQSPAWDIPYGLVEGSLFSKGLDPEIYCNEQGFVTKNIQWFTGPPDWSPARQAQSLSKAMARLLSNGEAKVNVFHAGGSEDEFGLIDEKGAPRPSYAVFADYLPLGQNSGRRLAISMTSADEKPLQGIYEVAATHQNGAVTVVLNPSETDEKRQITLKIPLSKAGNWKASLQSGETTANLPVSIKNAGAQMWAEVTLTLESRSILRLQSQ